MTLPDVMTILAISSSELATVFLYVVVGIIAVAILVLLLWSLYLVVVSAPWFALATFSCGALGLILPLALEGAIPVEFGAILVFVLLVTLVFSFRNSFQNFR